MMVQDCVSFSSVVEITPFGFSTRYYKKGSHKTRVAGEPATKSFGLWLRIRILSNIGHETNDLEPGSSLCSLPRCPPRIEFR